MKTEEAEVEAEAEVAAGPYMNGQLELPGAEC